MKQFNLKVDKTFSGLAGFEYGKEIYEKQVKNELSKKDFEDGICIIFPENIQLVASSFVQGFFSELLSRFGYYGVLKFLEVKSSSKDLSEYIIESLG